MAVFWILDHPPRPRLSPATPIICQNPGAGLSGRTTLMTLYMTVQVLADSLNGLHPVRTYQEVNLSFRWGETLTHLKDRHPDCIDICVHGGGCLKILPSNPNFSGLNNSGAIHRTVPSIPKLAVPAVDSSIITASPKSARRAQHSESMRTLAWR